MRQLVNEIRASVPGLSANLPPRRNIYGEAIEVPTGLGPDWLSPVFTNRAKHEDASDEVVRLNLRVAMPSRLVFGASDPTQRATLEGSPLATIATGVELTAQEYDDYIVLAAGGTVTDPAGREFSIRKPPLRDALNELVKSEKYQSWNDIRRASEITNLVNDYQARAENILRRAHPGLDEVRRERVNSARELMRQRPGRPPVAPRSAPQAPHVVR